MRLTIGRCSKSIWEIFMDTNNNNGLPSMIGLPQELPSWVHSVRDARNWIVCEYRKQGFTVIEEPTPQEMPPELSEFHLDVFAFRDEQHIATVIRRRNDISDNNIALAKNLKGRDNWRLDLVVLPISLAQNQTEPQADVA
jgi:hypothetical protein